MMSDGACNTVFDLIIAPTLITAPLTFFHLSSPTWRSFGTIGREQIYVSAPGAY